ncbi:MAG: hypothetical protein RQ885_06315 [Desulfurococcales archaeon]|jgi:hypothetical protein|nr:hypothetical protein [Desulfurococcales archaeon]
MRIAGIISMVVGVGVILQLVLGMHLERIQFLRDFHASIGILGLILVLYLTYDSLNRGSMVLKIASIATLIITLIQVVLGLYIYTAPSIFYVNLHMVTAVILVIAVAITGYISIRSSKRIRS